MNHRSLSLLPLLFFGVFVNAQTQAPAEVRKEEQRARTSMVKDAVQGGWSAQNEAEKLVEFDAAPALNAPAERLDQLRSVRNEALVRTHGQLTAADKDLIQRMADEVNTAFPLSFEAHLAEFYAQFPAPTSFTHADLALMSGPQRTEIIAPQLVSAARKDQREDLIKWSQAMEQRGEVAPQLYELASDILLSVDKNGVLIAAGEMDAYPLWVMQYANGKRSDVLVVDQRLLADPAYRARMWERARAKGPAPSDATGFLAKLHSATERPLFLSMAVGAQLAGQYRNELNVSGVAFRWGKPDPGEMTRLEQRWQQMNKVADAGPLARNYLLPGAVLLKHHRAVGNEEKAHALEAELRKLAARTGATKLMYENGSFQH